MADGKLERTPVKIMPFVDPEQAIAHMLMRPGKYEQLQLWRSPGDEPGPADALHLEGYAAFPDPDKPMKNITDGWAWRALRAGLIRRRTGTWKVEDVDVKELNQRFVSLPCGLVWQINIDWFQAVKNSNHSTGALYMSLCNNPRDIQFIREETFLVIAIPGPSEPSLEQLNHVLVSFTNSMKRLYNGAVFRVHGHQNPEVSHSQILSNVSDLPASRKTAGLPSHNSKFFMCPHCYMHFYELTQVHCFDPSRFKPRDDYRHLKYAFRAREATPEVAEEIFRKRGIRWSVMDELVGWLPAQSSSIDPMHAIMLTMIKHLNRTIIYNNGLLNSKSREEFSCIEKMETFFSKIVWPVSIGRLPPSLSHGAGSVKADQWRTQILVLFLALFAAWHVDGEIPDINAPSSPPNSKLLRAQQKSEKLVRKCLLESYMADNPNPSDSEINRIKKVKMDRSLRRHYEAILEFTAAVRILSTREISPNEVKRGFAALGNAVQSWARMFCHLTPYFHLAFHTEPQFYGMGPMYGWWAFGYERNNGFLGRFNHNGHSGGELEGTMMRRWWKTIFIHDLLTNLEMIQDPAPEDLNSIELLKSYLKGGTKERKGTLQNSLARNAGADTIQLSRFPRPLALRSIPGYYGLIFSYLSTLWGGKMLLYSDVSAAVPEGGAIFNGQVQAFSHIVVNGRRYGAVSQPRGRSAQYAYINDRRPVQIQHILRAVQPQSGGNDRIADFAIVRRFQSDNNIPEFPWDLRATDLGVHTWYADELGPPEAISLSQLSGHFILARLDVLAIEFWITVAYDHEKTEPDAVDEDEEA
ncbi:hypothetical protein B0H16DRAFT_1538396 [Mycena metata]|uniref:Uncharacterized protein n=1 Tax=Mycena metata TaxID=1033252 RepID=A0AAD7J4E3_9AGAR|nr:hypothetical protein B0H16DRAFT_1538396 [Mycena metata]